MRCCRGHGPLSHAFESTFLPQARAAGSDVPEQWHHEWASVWMLRHLIDANDLMPSFRERGLDESSVHLIQELILGDEEEKPPRFEWRGYPAKSFLFDIVANKTNGIDTDKVSGLSGPRRLALRVRERAGRLLHERRAHARNPSRLRLGADARVCSGGDL
jgi:hypothetical protein